jgi:hypothetical protein
MANAFRHPETKEFKPDWKERGEQLEAVRANRGVKVPPVSLSEYPSVVKSKKVEFARIDAA